MSKKSPQLRFKGFTDDWEDRNLKDILREFSTKSKIENEYRVLSSTNVGMEFRDGRVSGTSNLGYKIIKNGDLVLSPQNLWLGNININNIGTGLVSPSYKTFNFTDIDSSFIKPQLRTPKMLEEYKNSSTQGASVVRRNLEIDSFYQIKIATPSIKEQEKIGSFFKHLDSTISLHQRKLDLLKEQKKGFLQKMFPKNGAKVPELRFAGFADDWEERKLGDVVGEIQSGNRLPKDSLTSGNIPYVVAQTKNEGVFKTISKKTLDYNGNPMKLFPGNSISFSIDNPEAMFYRSTEFYTSNIMRVIHADYLSHQQYLFILENMKSFTRGYDWSRKFSGPVVSNLEYLQPNEQEQCKIGSFILAFDNIITLHQRKLDLLKEQKKGLLQKMFV